jgi:PEP-CTERM motif
MKFRLLLCFGGVAMLSSLAMASPVTCQSVLSVGNGNFGELITAGACDVGNVTFSGFNTTFTASSVLVSLNGFTGSPFGSIIGFTYNWLNGVFPGGGVGYTATFDPTEGTPCPVGYTCGIDGVETQLNSILGNGAMVTTNYTGGYVGSSHVDSASNADETYQTTIPIVVNPGFVMKAATYNGVGTINTFSTEVITAAVIPEPATFGLMGASLLAFGIFRKRFFRR